MFKVKNGNIAMEIMEVMGKGRMEVTEVEIKIMFTPSSISNSIKMHNLVRLISKITAEEINIKIKIKEVDNNNRNMVNIRMTQEGDIKESTQKEVEDKIMDYNGVIHLTRIKIMTNPWRRQ